MERYFDAFLYLANWGTRRLMFRFPSVFLDAKVARQYCHMDAASVIETSDHVIISLYLDRDPTTTGLRRMTGSGRCVRRAPTWPWRPPAAVPRLAAGSPSAPAKTIKTP